MSGRKSDLPGISTGDLSTLLHGSEGMLSPFSKELYIGRQSIVGMRFQGGAEALIDDLWRQRVSLFDYRGDVGLQGFQKVVFFAEHLIDSLNDYLLQVFLIDRPRSANMAGIL